MGGRRRLAGSRACGLADAMTMRGVKAMAGRLEASYERHRSSGLSLRTRKARWRLGGGWSFGETKRSLVSVSVSVSVGRKCGLPRVGTVKPSV